MQKNLDGFPPQAKETGVMLAMMDVSPETIVHSVIGITDAISSMAAEENNPPMKQPDDYTDIERAIAGMLTENTGTAMLDSGGLYGRHWEQNRRVADFRKAKALEANCDEQGVSFSLDVFHFLTYRLWIDDGSKALQQRFDRFAERQEMRRESWPAVVHAFIGSLKSEGFTLSIGDNTYNHDSMLSQGLDYTIVEQSIPPNRVQGYVFLQIHNGCDTRGGYTAPKVFACDPDECLFEPQVGATCGCGTIDTHDGGYHWYDWEGRLKDKNDYGLPGRWKVSGKKLKCTVCRKNIVFDAGE